MALNTTFVAGAVLTAAQMNNLPFGIVSVTSVTTSSAAVSAETLRITSPSFTAVANRFYRLTYIEPVILYSAGTVQYLDMNIRITSIAGALQQSTALYINSAQRSNGVSMVVKTLTAGATVFVGTFTPAGGGTAIAFAAAATPAQFIIEDLGST